MAWLLYLDKLTTWLWQDNDGAARWTLILDDVLRRASINHPPRTAAGLKIQVNHQSRLKHALVHAFAPHYPTTISLHPNTEALDASGNIVPFGTNLLRAIWDRGPVTTSAPPWNAFFRATPITLKRRVINAVTRGASQYPFGLIRYPQFNRDRLRCRQAPEDRQSGRTRHQTHLWRRN